MPGGKAYQGVAQAGDTPLEALQQRPLVPQWQQEVRRQAIVLEYLDELRLKIPNARRVAWCCKILIERVENDQETSARLLVPRSQTLCHGGGGLRCSPAAGRQRASHPGFQRRKRRLVPLIEKDRDFRRSLGRGTDLPAIWKRQLVRRFRGDREIAVAGAPAQPRQDAVF